MRSISWQSASLAALLAFAATQASAQKVDDRYPFLQPLETQQPAHSGYLRVGANGETQAAPARRSVARRAIHHAAAEIPFPRPAPARVSASAAPEPAADADEVTPAPTRLAYATQPNDDGLAIWSMIPIQPSAHRAPATPAAAATPTHPIPPAAIPVVAVLPETGALPHLEHRVLRGRDTHVFSPELLVMIENKALAYGVPLDLAHAVITVESNYDPRLTGAAGALGLMQIKHSTARGMGFRGSVHDLYDAATNLEWGMRYLAQARKLAHGDLCGTILRYQAGHAAARMTHAAAIYCAKVRALIAASDSPRRIARARAIR